MNKYKHMGGFSLVEALVAFVIAGIGLLGAAKMQAVMMHDNAISQQRNEAVVVAQDLIEGFRSFSSLESEAGSVAYDDIVTSDEDETVAGINASYSRRWTVEECCINATTLENACPATNCGSTEMRWKNITVTVAWTDKGNTANSVALATKISRLGPTLETALVASSGPPVPPGTGADDGSEDPESPGGTGGTDPGGDTGGTTGDPGGAGTIPPVTPANCTKSITLDPIEKQYDYASCIITSVSGICGCGSSTESGSYATFTCSATFSGASATVVYKFTRKNQDDITQTRSLICP